MENKYYFLKPGSDAFNKAFDKLAEMNLERFGSRDPVARNAEYLESWQYMCTVLQPNSYVYHQFRHRMHPVSNKRELYNMHLGRMTPELLAELDNDA
jgi:hypothetical protein